MEQKRTLTSRDNAQIIFEQSGSIEEGADDLKFMRMNEEHQELWLKIVELYPTLLDSYGLPS